MHFVGFAAFALRTQACQGFGCYATHNIPGATIDFFFFFSSEYSEGMRCWLNHLWVETSLGASGRQRWFTGWNLSGAHRGVKVTAACGTQVPPPPSLLQSFSVMICLRWCTWSCISMSITGVGDKMKSGRPHRSSAVWEPLLVTEVRWFMIYFPINPSLLRAPCPPVNKCQVTIPLHLPSHIHSGGFSGTLLPVAKAKLGRASTVIITPYLYMQMSGNWNKGRNGGEIKKPWMTELQWCWTWLEAGRLRTPGPLRQMVRVEGLHNTRLSHMSPNHTEPYGRP